MRQDRSKARTAAGSKLIVAGALLATLICGASHVFAQESTGSVTTSAATAPLETDPAQLAQQTIRQLAAALTDPGVSKNQRDEAARRLVALGTPEAKAALEAALLEQNIETQSSVARALADSAPSDPRFIDPLFAAYGANRPLNEAVSDALANYQDRTEVLTRLIDLAVNRQKPEAIRVEAIRAMGSFPEKRSAETLVNLIRRNDESVGIRRKSGDALADISGITENGANPQLWQDWWSNNSGKSDAQFRSEVLTRKSSEHDRDQSQLSRLAAELENSMRDQYALTPPKDREALLRKWLGSHEPRVRARAADLIREAFSEGRSFSPDLLADLRSLIGDSSVIVRQRVTLAFTNKADPQALQPLLVQLSVERDPQVREQAAAALSGIGDLRAAPALLKLLNDPSPGVARAAVNAFAKPGGLGEAVQKQDPQLAAQIATSLQQIIDRTSGTGDVELRASAVEALAPLKQGELIPLFYKLLRQEQEVERVRIAALNALREIGDRRTSDAIAVQINDPSDSVVYAAIRALGYCAPTADQLERLAPFLAANSTRDPSLRDVSWGVLQTMLPTLTKEQLAHWADVVRGDADKQIIIRKRLLDLQTAEKDVDGRATTQRQIADNYMEIKQPEAAVPFYRAALEHRQNIGQRGPQFDALIEGYMRSLLNSDNFGEAIAFASQTLSTDAGQRTTIGPLIRGRVEELSQSQQSDQLKKALTLIDQAKAMTPPLGAQYFDQLEDLRRQIDRRLSAMKDSSGGAPPADSIASPATTRPAIAGGQG